MMKQQKFIFSKNYLLIETTGDVEMRCQEGGNMNLTKGKYCFFKRDFVYRGDTTLIGLVHLTFNYDDDVEVLVGEKYKWNLLDWYGKYKLLDDVVQKHTKSIEQLVSTTEEHTNKLVEIEATVDTIGKHTNENINAIEKLKATTTALEENDKVQDVAIQELKELTTVLNEDNTANKTTISTLSSAVEQLKTTSTNHKALIDELTATTTELEQDNENNKKRLTALENNGSGAKIYTSTFELECYQSNSVYITDPYNYGGFTNRPVFIGVYRELSGLISILSLKCTILDLDGSVYKKLEPAFDKIETVAATQADATKETTSTVLSNNTLAPYGIYTRAEVHFLPGEVGRYYYLEEGGQKRSISNIFEFQYPSVLLGEGPDLSGYAPNAYLCFTQDRSYYQPAAGAMQKRQIHNMGLPTFYLYTDFAVGNRPIKIEITYIADKKLEFQHPVPYQTYSATISNSTISVDSSYLISNANQPTCIYITLIDPESGDGGILGENNTLCFNWNPYSQSIERTGNGRPWKDSSNDPGVYGVRSYSETSITFYTNNNTIGSLDGWTAKLEKWVGVCSVF